MLESAAVSCRRSAGHGRRCLVGYRTAWNRGGNLGQRLPGVKTRNFTTAGRTRFRSTRSSESRSKKPPVTEIFDDPHEQIFGSRSPKSLFCCVFGLMEERGELPKQLSRRKKPGFQDSGSLRNVDPGPSWTLRIFCASVRTAFFKRNQLPWFNPSLNTKMYFIVFKGKGPKY